MAEEQQKQQKVRKLTPAMQRYKAECRDQRNKARNIATDVLRKAKDADLRPGRIALRKVGALKRLDRRIRATAGKKSQRPLRAALQEIRIKVSDAAALWTGTCSTH